MKEKFSNGINSLEGGNGILDFFHQGEYLKAYIISCEIESKDGCRSTIRSSSSRIGSIIPSYDSAEVAPALKY